MLFTEVKNFGSIVILHEHCCMYINALDILSPYNNSIKNFNKNIHGKRGKNKQGLGIP